MNAIKRVLLVFGAICLISNNKVESFTASSAITSIKTGTLLQNYNGLLNIQKVLSNNDNNKQTSFLLSYPNYNKDNNIDKIHDEINKDLKQQEKKQNGIIISKKNTFKKKTTKSIMMMFLLSINILLTTTSILPEVSHADEEYEAPTLFTGESTEICIKRGPLGACTKTEKRTAENDNDAAKKYFSRVVTTNGAVVVDGGGNDYDAESNDLIKRLRQQTEDNKEKNAKIVKVKTQLNDASASFGPFDRNILILNTDGETFTLLPNPQAMRLKEQGYIKDKKFITQPSQDVLDATLNPPEEEGDGGGFFGGLIKGVFGGGD